MRHTLILTGGHLNMNFAKAYIKTLSFDKVFAVDKGLEYADRLKLTPDYIIGDFDTVTPKLLKRYEELIAKGKLTAKLERHQPQKDATDTELAIDTAIKEGARVITVLGATGSRMDHVLSNLQLLAPMEEKGVKGYIVDETNRIQLLADKGEGRLQIEKKKQFGTYISFIPISKMVEGITLKGMRYPLENATLHFGSSLSVSNQIEEEVASVQLEKGIVLVIESKDE